ncbi:MAG TPA: hypothetical protein VE172_05715 [Stackebrandtia sp.]|uniref:hypothetical protein n=1 Tax=Stackebrandtia sp. TaxID=2023065 RepID=UPI002D6536DF|nr:hypothetical protein [Stackebrandtia sp.]HZE38291.1 hypothetical protein [Stackebrandtia sp.]
MSTELVARAAANNAAWCQSMCAAHGLPGELGEHAWTSPRRTPRFYPDAVTLDDRATVEDMLSRVDNSAGCSIKDSFHLLDLTSHGFFELFYAQWIHRPGDAAAPSAAADERWRVIDDPEALSEWERLWADDDKYPSDPLFVPELLNDPTVSVVGGYSGDELIGGAVLNLGGGGVGISNVFTLRSDSAASWAGALSVAGQRHPGQAVFGYEPVEYLDMVAEFGFSPIGMLRIWWRRK